MTKRPSKPSFVALFALALSLAAPVSHAANQPYTVTGVEVYDALNIRSAPGVNNAIIGRLPPNGRTIILTGDETQLRRSTWVKIQWLDQVGWVNKRYLAAANINPSFNSKHSLNRNTGMNSGGMDVSQHIHPRNECTSSITHGHPNGTGNHSHHYSCDMKTKSASINSHTHPSNQCTNSITHEHPNGVSEHKHRYSCQGNGQNAANARLRPMSMSPKGAAMAKMRVDPNAHTHPANRLTRSTTHTHLNGAGHHTHRYSARRP